MSGGLLLFILAFAAGADDAPLAAHEIYRGDFEAAMDADYDGWPDGWVRRRSPAGPDFARVTLAPRPSSGLAASGQPARDAVSHGQALVIHVGGGRTEIATPVLPIDRLFSLLAVAEISCEKIERSDVRWRLVLLDEQGGVVDEKSQLIDSSRSDFTLVQLGPLIPPAKNVAAAQLVLAISPREGRGDLSGVVRVDNVRLLRLPRMSLSASEKLGLFHAFDGAEIRCDLSGVSQVEPRVRFELLDYQGAVLQAHEAPLAAPRKALPPLSEAPPTATPPPAPLPLPAAPMRAGSLQEPFAASVTWKPQFPDFGFYRVRVALLGNGPQGAAHTVLVRTAPVAVLRPLARPEKGEFGWSLPAGERPYGVGDLATIVEAAGVNWVKYPVWFGDEESARADRIAWFAERLSIHKIELIGVFDQPPEQLRSVFREPGRIPVASLFHDPEWWPRAIDPVLTRLSLKVRWWQLGDDYDASFVGLPGMAERVQEIRRHMERFGQRARLGVGWKWLWEPPQDEAPPWAFLALSGQPDLTAAEIGEYLPGLGRSAVLKGPAVQAKPGSSRTPVGTVTGVDRGAKAAPPQVVLTSARNPLASGAQTAAPQASLRMLALSPLPRGVYAADVRAADLVQRMLAAKIHGAGGVFVTDPFSDVRGLYDEDGAPTELFLPWRTTASLVAGTEYLGSLQLGGGAVNHLFAGESQGVLALWSDQPGHETFFLGDEVSALDIWGRSVPVEPAGTGDLRLHRVAIGPTPVFVLGVNPHLARWQIAARFERAAIDSIYGREQRITLTAPNSFAQGVTGAASLRAPEAWNLSPLPQPFRGAAGEAIRITWPLTLLAEADSGLQTVTIDVTLAADKPYRFQLHRQLFLGLDDVAVQTRTRLREDGSLLVEQTINNLAQRPLSFQCVLFPPGRRRETNQARDLPPGRTTVLFVLPDGESLIGQKLYLRAEEIGGSRVLTSTAVVER